MEILIDNKKIMVESAKWWTEHKEYYLPSRDYSQIEFDIDYVNITIDKNIINDFLCLILEKNEHKIEFDGKVANFYIRPENLNKLFFELKNKEVEKLNILFVGTNTGVGE